MALFFQMVGAVFVALLLLVIVGILWLRWKLRSFTSQFVDNLGKMAKNLQMTGGMGMLYVPPMTLDLSPAEDDAITHTQEFELATLEVQNQGFKRGELYELGELGAVCRSLFHSDRRIDVVVYDHPLLNVWVEYCAFFADGTSLSFSNCQQTSGLDQPPDRDTRFFPGEQIAALWERFRLEIADRPIATHVTADTFASRFVKSYNEEMQWRIDRGGVTEDEVRRCVEMGGGEFSEDHCEMVQQTWRMRIAQHIDEQLRTAFTEGSSMSLSEYEKKRDRLVFIHEQTATDQMLLYVKIQDEDEEDDADDADAYEEMKTKLQQRCQAASPRAVFKDLRDAGELNGHYEFLKEMTTPYTADVYVSSHDGGRY